MDGRDCFGDGGCTVEVDVVLACPGWQVAAGPDGSVMGLDGAFRRYLYD